jgi:hypothetical protein
MERKDLMIICPLRQANGQDRKIILLMAQKMALR